ncbi:MAG: VacJ family lipoprotein [Deltaproteobacteria bacterium]|nr:VacJ family lipoprotein [Deltaproteobacteria bacterium]
MKTRGLWLLPLFCLFLAVGCAHNGGEAANGPTPGAPPAARQARTLPDASPEKGQVSGASQAPGALGQAARSPEKKAAVKTPAQTPGEPSGMTMGQETGQATNQSELDRLLEGEEEPAAPQVADPIEGWNRVVFAVNDAFYMHILDPVLRGYRFVMPKGYRIVSSNFFANLVSPLRVVSSLLAGQFKKTSIYLARFGINTTMGILGAGDAAKDIFDLPEPGKEDLGLTLGHWGIPHGMYLVWPLLGPNSLRDSVGLVGGWWLDPVWYVDPFEAAFGIQAYRFTNDASFSFDGYKTLRDSAIDPYVAFRDAYFQLRQKQLQE